MCYYVILLHCVQNREKNMSKKLDMINYNFSLTIIFIITIAIDLMLDENIGNTLIVL